MPQTVERIGRPAAPGLAAGPLFRLDRRLVRRTASGDLKREQRDLDAAIKAAIAEIETLAARSEGAAVEILDFQVAMLEDTVLSAPAFDRIEAGADAATAWSETIAAQVADYESTADSYFRARAADLKDLGDRVLLHLAGEDEIVAPPGAVLSGEDVTPTRFLSVDWSKGGGIALLAGSPSSHVAVLARSRGVPMVVGLGDLDLAEHRSAIVDGDAGRIVLSPGPDEWKSFEKGKLVAAASASREAGVAFEPARTADGVPITVMVNIAGPEELATIDPAICDGIGLVRTEFMFHGSRGLPDEETQFEAYRRVVEWAGGRPVVFRTLDAGGDKPIEGLTIPGESNPFLGTRGIRLSLARPDVFRVQLRALARVAALGNVKVMLPMVTVPAEIDAAARLLDRAVAELSSEGTKCRRPLLGIMVEVPAVAIEPELFAAADFFSIGSNDLTQYVTASARDIAAVATLNDPSNPAVMSLIRRMVRIGGEIGREVGLCGDMGGDPVHLPGLIAAGLRTISIAPALVGRAKLAIAEARS